MKTKQFNQKGRGFTIIEVLIVLTIAGLILLIVFLAVPALQRNSRNNSRTSDVSKLLGAVNEYASNNSGALPATCSGGTGGTPVQFGAASGGSQTNIGYYNANACAPVATVPGAPTSGTVYLLTAAGVVDGGWTNAAHDIVAIFPGDSCNGTSSQAGSARQFVALYEIETGSNAYITKCQAS